MSGPLRTAVYALCLFAGVLAGLVAGRALRDSLDPQLADRPGSITRPAVIDRWQ